MPRPGTRAETQPAVGVPASTCRPRGCAPRPRAPCRGLLLASCRSPRRGKRGRWGLPARQDETRRSCGGLREGGWDACSPGRRDSSGGGAGGTVPSGLEATLAASRNAGDPSPSSAGICAAGERKGPLRVTSWARSPGRRRVLGARAQDPRQARCPRWGPARCWTASLCAPVFSSAAERTPGLAGDAPGRGPESSRSVESRYPAAASVLRVGAAGCVEGPCCPLAAEE